MLIGLSIHELFLNQTKLELADLATNLQEFLQKTDDKSMILEADRIVPHGTVVQVMDIARGAGIRKIVIATDKGVKVLD